MQTIPQTIEVNRHTLMTDDILENENKYVFHIYIVVTVLHRRLHCETYLNASLRKNTSLLSETLLIPRAIYIPKNTICHLQRRKIMWWGSGVTTELCAATPKAQNNTSRQYRTGNTSQMATVTCTVLPSAKTCTTHSPPNVNAATSLRARDLEMKRQFGDGHVCWNSACLRLDNTNTDTDFSV